LLPAPASPLLAALLLAAPAGAVEGPPPDSLVARGEYVFRACDCKACHTDEKHRGKVLAGGRALKTDFGTFYPPNITPDPDTGIGRWSERDFVRSMREGLGRSGENLYPSFPYPAYTRLSDEDLGALWAYLRAQPPVRQENRPHDLHWFARVRPLVGLWKMLYFRAGPQQPDPARSASWNRGAYLAEAAVHCGECHTPRSALGGLKASMRYAGAQNGPEGSAAPNVTPDRKTGIGRWSRGDLATYLGTGLAPDGDSAGGLMAETIDNGLKDLSKDDLAAIAEYVMSLPAVENQVRKPKKRREKSEYE
jgi:mono/diheme cytochrome c family protein